MNTFGEKLKELRMEKGLSQKALAEQLGCNQSMISFWENGINEPTITNLLNLSKIFEVSTDYLLGLED